MTRRLLVVLALATSLVLGGAPSAGAAMSDGLCLAIRPVNQGACVDPWP